MNDEPNPHHFTRPEPRLGQAPVLVNPLSAKRVQIGEDTVEISFQSEHLKKSTAERFLRGQRRNLMVCGAPALVLVVVEEVVIEGGITIMWTLCTASVGQVQIGCASCSKCWYREADQGYFGVA